MSLERRPVDPANPFLLLRLPANADANEIRRVGQRATMEARLGGDGATPARAIEDALTALQDPVARFRHGLTWPALGPRGAEILRQRASFAALVSNPAHDCSADVEELLADLAPHDRSHGRAVFSLLRARGLVERALVGTNTPSGAKWDFTTAEHHMARGFADWHTAVNSREFWIAQRLHARQLDDARLDPTMVVKIESQAPMMALAVFASFVAAAIRQQQPEGCFAVLRALRASPFPADTVERSITEACAAECSRIEETVKQYEARANTLQSADPQIYVGIIDEYERHVAPEVRLVRQIWSEAGTIGGKLGDAAAEFLRIVAVRAANHADAHSISERALRLANEMAVGHVMRSRVANDQSTLRNLAADAQRSKRTRPLSTKLTSALKASDYQTAVQTIDELIPIESIESAKELRQLRVQVTTAWATQLFNRSAAAAREGKIRLAIQLNSEAAQVETNPKELDIIAKQALQLRFMELQSAPRGTLGALDTRRIRAASSGCLVPFALAVLVAPTSGWAIGSALWYLLHAAGATQ